MNIEYVYLLFALVAPALLWRVDHSFKGGKSGVGSSVEGSTKAIHTMDVVVPARNEENSLPGLLTSLSGQLLASTLLSVTVVDDHSSDSTVKIANSFGVNVVSANELERSYNPKSNALATYQSQLKGDVVVFLDADVTLLDEEFLDELRAAQLASEGCLISVQPYHRCGSIYESLALFPNLMALMGSGAFSIWNPRHHSKVAFGPVLCVAKSAYKKVGGHRRIVKEVLDDAGLAQSFLSSGYEVKVFAGSRGVAFRMYPEGIRQLVQGFTKNLAPGALRTSLVSTTLSVLWVVGFLGSSAALLSQLGSGALLSPSLTAIAGVAVFVFMVETYLFGRKIGRYSPIWYLLSPLALLFFLSLFIGSFVKVYLARSISWKDRSISLRESSRD